MPSSRRHFGILPPCPPPCSSPSPWSLPGLGLYPTPEPSLPPLPSPRHPIARVGSQTRCVSPPRPVRNALEPLAAGGPSPVPFSLADSYLSIPLLYFSGIPGGSRQTCVTNLPLSPGTPARGRLHPAVVTEQGTREWVIRWGAGGRSLHHLMRGAVPNRKSWRWQSPRGRLPVPLCSSVSLTPDYPLPASWAWSAESIVGAAVGSGAPSGAWSPQGSGLGLRPVSLLLGAAGSVLQRPLGQPPRLRARTCVLVIPGCGRTSRPAPWRVTSRVLYVHFTGLICSINEPFSLPLLKFSVYIFCPVFYQIIVLISFQRFCIYFGCYSISPL